MPRYSRYIPSLLQRSLRQHVHWYEWRNNPSLAESELCEAYRILPRATMINIVGAVFLGDHAAYVRMCGPLSVRSILGYTSANSGTNKFTVLITCDRYDVIREVLTWLEVPCHWDSETLAAMQYNFNSRMVQAILPKPVRSRCFGYLTTEENAFIHWLWVNFGP